MECKFALLLVFILGYILGFLTIAGILLRVAIRGFNQSTLWEKLHKDKSEKEN